MELLEARLPKTELAAAPRPQGLHACSRLPATASRGPTEQYHVCLAAPGISRRDDRRFAASLLDSIVGGSASSRLFQEIREKRGMAYSVYSFASQYSDTGQVGLYVDARGEPRRVLRDRRARARRHRRRGTCAPGELERAKESLKGRILLSLESTSNRMSRLGKSLITDTELLSLDEIVERIDAVRADDVAELAGDLLPARPPLGGRDRPERGALPRRGPARQSGARRAHGRMKVFLLGRQRKVGSVLGPALEEAGHELVESDRRRGGGGRLHAPGRGRGERARLPRGGRPRVVGTTGFDQERVAALAREHELPVFYAPNFALGAVLMMRFAAEAGKVLPDAEIVELHHETKLDAPSGTAKATAALLPEGTPIHSVRLPGLVAHQEVIFGGPGQTLTIRHDTTSREAFVPGVLLALEQLRSLPPGLTVGLDALL